MKSCFHRLIWAMGLWLACGWLAGPTVRGQEVLRWLEYTNLWRYHQTGADLGSAWKEPAFDDSGWPSGAGLLAWETNMPSMYPVPVNTVLALGEPAVITYYFRTTFELAEVPAALAELWATAYADDGCVVYLNGLEVGRVRVPVGQGYQTLTTGVAPYEGVGEVFSIRPDVLRPGRNVLAAEVHQSAVGSSDVVWGLKLRAVVATPIAVTGQPASRSAIVGQTNVFSVETTGGPVVYQWFKDGAAVADATNRTLTLAGIQLTNAGDYTVMASNRLGARFSQEATLTVVPATSGDQDRTGPRVVRALIRGTLNNFVDIEFSERIASASVVSTCCVVRSLDDDSLVPVASLLTSGSTVRLRMTGENWAPVGTNSYQVIVNRIADTSPNANRVPPDSRAPVLRLRQTEVLATNALWDHHAFVLEDPSVLEGEWYRPDLVLSEFWRAGRPPFYTPAAGGSTCLGPGLTSLPFQFHPMLFRTTFEVTNDLPTDVTLVLGGVATSGLAVYLNGGEVYREGLPPAPAALTVDTRATALSTVLACRDRVISNVRLRQGTNHLACAVYQYRDGQSFPTVGYAVQFGLAGRLEYYEGPPWPLPPSPRLDATPIGSAASPALRLSWSGPGFALETSTNLGLGGASAPFGPWMDVTNMSNPYTNFVTGPARFFRLKQ